MPTTNKLTDSKCRAAKAQDKAYKLFDGRGLYLWVSATGSRTWRLAYRLNGKPQTAAFGPYPDVSLSEARERRDDLLAKLRSGDDPRQKPTSKTALTLARACDEYWDGRGDLTADYVRNARNGIKTYLLPQLGDRDIASIERSELLAELQKVAAAGRLVYVRRIRMWISQVYDWAVENGHATINPASLINPRKAFAHPKKSNFAAVEIPEVKALWQRLSLEGDLQSALACRMLAYTWTRTTELRSMRWDEIEGSLWRLPAGRMKRQRDHIVPLSRQALVILEKMRQRSNGSEFVFRADHTALRPISENAILYLIYRMGYRGRMTGHGWRSIGSTWANEEGFNADAIERQLAHAPEDKTRGAYNRAAYLPERTRMLQQWADWLESHEIDAGSA